MTEEERVDLRAEQDEGIAARGQPPLAEPDLRDRVLNGQRSLWIGGRGDGGGPGKAEWSAREKDRGGH